MSVDEKGRSLMSSLPTPDPPLVAAGVFGGPFVVYLVTPLRNALTLGAQDTTLSFAGVYRRLFSNGFVRGWAGGHHMAIPAVPGFLVLGPMFHVFRDIAGGSTVAAVGLTAASESVIFFGAETKNAQIAYNQAAAQRGGMQVAKLQSSAMPWGPGIGVYVVRNYVAMSGLRILSRPCQDFMSVVAPTISPGTREILGDMTANVFVSALSTPLHQLYQFVTTQRLAEPALAQKPFAESASDFFRKQYLTSEGRISRVAGRDVGLRIAMNATIFTIYGFIERTALSNWPTIAVSSPILTYGGGTGLGVSTS